MEDSGIASQRTKRIKWNASQSTFVEIYFYVLIINA